MIKKILILLLMLAVLVSNVNAQPLKIDMGDIFMHVEKVYFNYTIDLNRPGEEVRYLVGLKCDNLPDTLLEPKSERLNYLGKLNGTYNGFVVDEQYTGCFAYLSVLSPFEINAKKSFNISGLLNIILDLKTCTDFSCSQESRVFISGENIYLNYSVSVENPDLKAILAYPDGTSKSISLPTSIKAEQIGTYELEITASKAGYKNATKKTQFGVIEQQAQIPMQEVVVGEANFLQQKEAEIEKRPLNASLIDIFKEKTKSSKVITYSLIAILSLIAIGVAFVLYRIIKKRKKFAEVNE